MMTSSDKALDRGRWARVTLRLLPEEHDHLVSFAAELGEDVNTFVRGVVSSLLPDLVAARAVLEQMDLEDRYDTRDLYEALAQVYDRRAKRYRTRARSK
jgi:hypothetical protein